MILRKLVVLCLFGEAMEGPNVQFESCTGPSLSHLGGTRLCHLWLASHVSLYNVQSESTESDLLTLPLVFVVVWLYDRASLSGQTIPPDAQWWSTSYTSDLDADVPPYLKPTCHQLFG